MTNLLDSLGLNISVTEAGMSSKGLDLAILNFKNQSTLLVFLLRIR